MHRILNAMGKESEAEAAAADRRWITSEDHAANRGSVVPVLGVDFGGLGDESDQGPWIEEVARDDD